MENDRERHSRSVIVTRERDGETFETEHRQEHLEVSRLSRAGRLVVAERRGHHIQIDQPDLVIQAIHDVLLSASGRCRELKHER